MYHLRFHAYQAWHCLPVLITASLSRELRRMFAPTSFDGISIVDMSLRRGLDERFQADIVAALNLIKRVDPRRYHRIQREVRCIKNTEQIPITSYARLLQTCTFDYSRIDARKNPEWYHWWLAMKLVHEASHGAIYSRNIAYTPGLRLRIERLCHREETRFAKRADMVNKQWCDALVSEFDERRWQPHWNMTAWERVTRLIARIREARRSLPK